MGDGIVSVDGKGDQDVSARVCDHSLKEADELAQDDASMPRHRDPLYYVRWNVD